MDCCRRNVPCPRLRGSSLFFGAIVFHIAPADALQRPFGALDTVPPSPSLVRSLARERRIRQLYLQGLTRPEIAIKEGVSRATVDRTLRE